MAQGGEGEPVQLEGEVFKDKSSEAITPQEGLPSDPAGSPEVRTPQGKIKRRRRVRTNGEAKGVSEGIPTEKPITQVITIPRSQGGRYWFEED